VPLFAPARAPSVVVEVAGHVRAHETHVACTAAGVDEGKQADIVARVCFVVDREIQDRVAEPFERAGKRRCDGRLRISTIAFLRHRSGQRVVPVGVCGNGGGERGHGGFERVGRAVDREQARRVCKREFAAGDEGERAAFAAGEKRQRTGTGDRDRRADGDRVVGVEREPGIAGQPNAARTRISWASTPLPVVAISISPLASMASRSDVLTMAFFAVGAHRPPEQFICSVGWEEMTTAPSAGASGTRVASASTPAAPRHEVAHSAVLSIATFPRFCAASRGELAFCRRAGAAGYSTGRQEHRTTDTGRQAGEADRWAGASFGAQTL